MLLYKLSFNLVFVDVSLGCFLIMFNKCILVLKGASAIFDFTVEEILHIHECFSKNTFSGVGWSGQGFGTFS